MEKYEQRRFVVAEKEAKNQQGLDDRLI